MEINNYHRKNENKQLGKIASFFLFKNLLNNYNNDKNLNDEERKGIKKYGVISIILSTIALILSVVCFLSSIIGTDLLGFSYVIMMIIYIIGGIIVSVILSIYGFIFGILQIRLNRKSLGVFGIAFSSISVVFSVLLIIFMFV